MEKLKNVFQEAHDFHVSYLMNGVIVELHQSVSRFPVTKQGEYAKKKMEEALQYTHIESIGEATFSVLDPQYQIIALLSHMERHMIDSSISLRQLCDWAVTVHRFRNQVTECMLQELEKCGLRRFACVLTRVCIDFLGMPEVSWCDDVASEYVCSMHNEIIAASNMNHPDVERALSSTFVDRTPGGIVSLLQSYTRKVSLKAQQQFPIVKRMPILLPVFWLYYPLLWKMRAVQGERKDVSFISAFRLANKRKQLYNWLGLFQKNV